MNKKTEILIPTETIQLISGDMARTYRIVPKKSNETVLEVFTEKSAAAQHSDLEIILGKKIVSVVITKEKLNFLLSRYYRKSRNKQRVQRLVYDENFLQNLINAAKDFGSSDIHLEPYENNARVRIRIDGKLKEHFIVKKEDYFILVNKIKIQSHMDISEKRLPQDGRMKVKNRLDEFDLRVSVLPTLHGEKVVLRLLSRENASVSLEKLGFTAEQKRIYTKNIQKPHGIILISGPTGSGKTTTLYATLKQLNKTSRNIVTIEDPIEYTLEGINQVQLRENIGLTFTGALRTFLRQDPDIIMVGEIRDVDTANMAIRASLTGHLVFSTIHTNSALATISRLTDMGIPPFLIADTLNMSIAQRLIRKLCPFCKEIHGAENGLLPQNYKPKEKLKTHYIAVGCEECYYTGYSGRKAVYEIIDINEEIMSDIRKNKIESKSIFYKKYNIKSLLEQAFELVETGETSLEEMYALI